MNTVFLLGNILNQVLSGRPVLNIRLAVDKPPGAQGDVNWFDVTVWGTAAEVNARHLTKGSQILVEGQLNQRTFQNRDGQTVNAVEVIARNITWLNIKPKLDEDS